MGLDQQSTKKNQQKGTQIHEKHKKHISNMGIVPILIVLVLFFTAFTNNFFSFNNFTNIFRESSINIILAVGMTMVILIGGIDLSVGSVVTVTAVVALKFSLIPEMSWLAVPAGLMAGGIIGAFQGFLVAKFKMPSFIVTLGGLSIWRGVAYLLAGGTTLINNDISYAWIGNARLLGLPYIVWIAFIVLALALFVLKKTVFGTHIYATGGNSQAASFTGINIFRVYFFVFVIIGVLSGLVGVILSSRLYSANGFLGTSFELDAIAAVILGGTSFIGGIGGVGGTFIGALIIAVINNGLTIMNFSYYSQLIMKGLVIILAVLIDILRREH